MLIRNGPLCDIRVGISVFSSSQYGQGSGPILIDDIACSGTETSLQSCTYDSNTGDCSHVEDAGVRCHSCELSVNNDYRIMT